MILLLLIWLTFVADYDFSKTASLRPQEAVAESVQTDATVDDPAAWEKGKELEYGRRMLGWTACAAAPRLGLRAEHRAAMDSWKAAGATDILILGSQLESDENAIRFVRRGKMPGCLTLDVMIEDCENSAKTEWVVMLKIDASLPIGFGGVLGALDFATSTSLAPVVLGGRRKSDEKSGENSAPEGLAFKKGLFSKFGAPSLCVDGGMWIEWLWNEAMRRNWMAVDGGNSILVNHKIHNRNHDTKKSNAINLEIMTELGRNGLALQCPRLSCAQFFIYSGKCRNQLESASKILQNSFICLRRKTSIQKWSTDAVDEKIAFANAENLL